MMWPNNSYDDIDPYQIVNVPNGDHNYNDDIQAFNNSRATGLQMRDNIAQQMWHDYVARRT